MSEVITESNTTIAIANPTALQPFFDAKSQITQLADLCKQLVIVDDPSLESAENLAKKAKALEKKIEDTRKEITKPILDKKKEIDDMAKDLTNDLNAGIKELREQILKYKLEQERIRKEAERKIEEERKAKEEELRKQMAENKEVKQEDLAALQEIKQQQAIAMSAPPSKGIQKHWDYDLIDLGLVPIEYLMLDDKAVKQAIANGVRIIPGIVISQKDRLVLR